MTLLHAPARSVALASGPVDVKFTVRKLMQLEELYGSYAAMSETWDAKEGTVTAQVLGVALGVDMDAAADMMDGVGVRPVKSVLIDAVNDAIGGPRDDTVDPPTPGTPTPGTTS